VANRPAWHCQIDFFFYDELGKKERTEHESNRRNKENPDTCSEKFSMQCITFGELSGRCSRSEEKACRSEIKHVDVLLLKQWHLDRK
jgi:hypothetical protein